MSFFHKMFASIGIGAAKVDTKLASNSFCAGEIIEGVVEVKGGNVEQKIDEIYLTVLATYMKEDDDQKYTKQAEIAKVKLNEPFVITANEHKTIPFSFQLPLDTPITKGSSRVWIHTGLDIKGAVDPEDRDYIEVVPNELTNAVFKSIGELGFQLKQVENEEAPYRLRKRLPFIQEFEFYPVEGPFRGRLDELEVVFFQISQNEIEVVFEIDRRARGLAGFLAEALEMDESLVKVTITNRDIHHLTEQLADLLNRYC
ncbi:sporulation protein [Bacillus sp. FJAT-47783]|uniref:sporulation protein n=1 Tax=Bacillus sp. FJAT-47783 TaxID=2922712 RepID=UPI001FAD7875|nr:sporulation protein [Bacillus sp. FJAT-47783]